MRNNKLTLSTCWYELVQKKHSLNKFLIWIDKMLSNVHNYNLVIYTNTESIHHIIKYNLNPNIKIIIKPLENFYTYKFKENFIKNHENNHNLNKLVNWEINMLWCEKIAFVYDTIINNYFNSDFYGWCDIGYFREDYNNIDVLKNWPENNAIESLNKNLIYYNMVQKNSNYIENIKNIINNKNEFGLPNKQIPADQVTISGGFFILYKDKIEYLNTLFYSKLELYFNHNYLVKDDQIILSDCIFSNFDKFHLISENLNLDNWFAFSRFLNEKYISILIPLYNGIEFIEESINSVFNQTYKNWEIILGVNGHSENSEVYQIAKKYEEKSDKIKVYNLETKGKSDSMNYMLKLCTYDYVAILDVDDKWENNKLNIQVEYLNKYDIVGTKCVYFDELNISPEIPIKDISNFDFINVNPIINSSAIVKKELCYWDKFYEGIEDYDMWLRLRYDNKKFYNCEEILTKHRIHKKSSFNTKNTTIDVENLRNKYRNINIVKIPKIIHQLWIGNKPAPINLMNTWKEKNKDFEYIFWNEDEFKKRNINFKCQNRIDEIEEINGKADIIRWEILYHYGGIFIDADSICLEPIDNELLDKKCFAGWEQESIRYGLIATGTMGFPKKHPIVKSCIDWIYNNEVSQNKTGHQAWITVGPMLLTKMYKTGNFKDLHIFPSYTFLPEHNTGVEYNGHGKIYSYQLWGSTHQSYDIMNNFILPSKYLLPKKSVSIVICSYNTNINYINECLDSIKNQIGEFNIELVWINDGSTYDNTLLLKKSLNNFKNTTRFIDIIYYENIKNKGLGYSLALGNILSSNEIILRMDSDDIMIYNRIINQLTYMENNPTVNICAGQVYFFVDNIKNITGKTQHPSILWEDYKKKKEQWIANHPTLCYRRNAVLDIGNYDPLKTKMIEDLDLELRFLKKYNFIYNFEEPLLYYRLHNDQVTHNQDTSWYEKRNELIDKIIIDL
jgi:glycosyltransferase involved in cell wall biosynthesis